MAGACPGAPSGGAAVVATVVDIHTVNDTMPAQAAYCYYVEADDLLTGPASRLRASRRMTTPIHK